MHVVKAGWHSACPIVDVAFVDDECLMLAANTPSTLDANIDILLVSLSSVFKKLLKIEIKWKPGKTECCSVYRGGHATDHYRARRVGANGSLAVRVPISGELITVVSQ